MKQQNLPAASCSVYTEKGKKKRKQLRLLYSVSDRVGCWRWSCPRAMESSTGSFPPPPHPPNLSSFVCFVFQMAENQKKKKR